jgi:nitrite reductase/ring-hydroxylating ferredoxin subunit
MTGRLEDREFHRRMEQFDRLMQEVEAIADPATRAHVQQVIQGLLEFHGAGLRRMLEQAAENGQTGQSLIDHWGQDALVSSLLLRHGPHPLDLDAHVLCRVAGTLYAYQDACATCSGSLDGGQIAGSELTCPVCGARFDLCRAGRGLDQLQLHLTPIPLLVEAGRVPVALAPLACETTAAPAGTIKD